MYMQRPAHCLWCLKGLSTWTERATGTCYYCGQWGRITNSVNPLRQRPWGFGKCLT